MYETKLSKKLYKRSLEVLVEGGSSPSRGPAVYGDNVVFIERGAGSRVVDVDGNSYIDWMMAYGALPLGHAPQCVVDAVTNALSEGTLFAACTEIEVEVAELIKQTVPTAERIRFANTGTEAAMAVLRLARGYTGKQKFIKFEGHYHGWYDDFLVNAHPHQITSIGHVRDPIKIAESSGLNKYSLEDTIVVPWNDIEAVERAIDTYRGQIAAIFTEGIMANMGVIPPEEGYLHALQALSKDNGILFVLDETVTGFRIAAGGCQELFGLKPDICIFGKALGSGFPIAAFAGREDIMQALEWGGVLHYGTQNASRIGLFAARASLRKLIENDGESYKYIWNLGNEFCEKLRNILSDSPVNAIVQSVGPMFQIMFTDRKSIKNYRDFCESVDRKKYQKFVLGLFRHGVYMSPSAALHSVVTTAHTANDVDLTLEAVGKTLNDTKI